MALAVAKHHDQLEFTEKDGAKLAIAFNQPDFVAGVFILGPEEKSRSAMLDPYKSYTKVFRVEEGRLRVEIGETHFGVVPESYFFVPPYKKFKLKNPTVMPCKMSFNAHKQ